MDLYIAKKFQVPFFVSKIFVYYQWELFFWLRFHAVCRTLVKHSIEDFFEKKKLIFLCVFQRLWNILLSRIASFKLRSKFLFSYVFSFGLFLVKKSHCWTAYMKKCDFLRDCTNFFPHLERWNCLSIFVWEKKDSILGLHFILILSKKVTLIFLGQFSISSLL